MSCSQAAGSPQVLVVRARVSRRLGAGARGEVTTAGEVSRGWARARWSSTRATCRLRSGEEGRRSVIAAEVSICGDLCTKGGGMKKHINFLPSCTKSRDGINQVLCFIFPF